MRNKFFLYFHTIRHLRFLQIKYRIWYALRDYFFGGNNISSSIKLKSVKEIKQLQFLSFIPNYDSVKELGDNKFEFTFLNLSKKFEKKIDWNYSEYGKLWTYNLNYFEFLHQNEIKKNQGLFLIYDFIENFESNNDAKEPFPTSLRIINWVKFLARYQINDSKINQSLFLQTKLLEKNLEFHLLGNHLLENAFALLFAAYYFEDKFFLARAKKFLQQELTEQILSDGGHFELSPMYHQIMLFRVLDSINLTSLNKNFDDDLLGFLIQNASKMLSWLKKITFQNGDIPLVNDCANKIAPNSKTLFGYAKKLKVSFLETPLQDSGYRKINTEKFELFFDFGKVGPSYQPGHAHSDSLSFVLYLNGYPFIIDTGTSTYEKNEIRQAERSTSSHNTVQVNEIEQSAIWGGFRVGRRAETKILVEGKDNWAAEHDGFRSQKIFLKREFFTRKNEIKITDDSQQNGLQQMKAFFHFHPDVKFEVKENKVECEQATIIFQGHQSIKIQDFYFAPEFNKLLPSKKIIVHFDQKLETTIHVN